MKGREQKKLVVLELEGAPFRTVKDAVNWAESHGITGVMTDVDTNGKGRFSISVASFKGMASKRSVEMSVTPAIHFAVLRRLRDIVRESRFEGRSRLSGRVSFGGIPYRVRITLKSFECDAKVKCACRFAVTGVEVAGEVCGDLRIRMLESRVQELTDELNNLRAMRPLRPQEV